jgi:hypothetical protein
MPPRVKPNRRKVNIDKLSRAIEMARRYLKCRGIDIEAVTSREMITYFDGEAPSGDTTTLRDAVNQRWLMIHEIIEVSELRRRHLNISASILRNHAREVHECHLVASRIEFGLARQENDSEWLRTRVPLIRSWRNDDGMTDEIWTKYLELEREFREYL